MDRMVNGMARSLRWVAVASTVAAALLHCAVKATDSLDESTETIGPSGGLVQTPNSSVYISAGALTEDQTITCEEVPSAPNLTQGAQVGQAILCQPEGLSFAEPVSITLALDVQKLGSSSPTSVVIYTAPQGNTVDYTPLVTTVAATPTTGQVQVVAQTTHFSYFVPVLPGAPQPRDSGVVDSTVIQPIPDTGTTPDTTTPPPPPTDSGSSMKDSGSPTDSGKADTVASDTGTVVQDTGTVADSGSPSDTSVVDTGTTAPETGPADTGTPDTGTPDTGTVDTGTPDTGTPDTGTPDTGSIAESGSAPESGVTDTNEPTEAEAGD